MPLIEHLLARSGLTRSAATRRGSALHSTVRPPAKPEPRPDAAAERRRLAAQDRHNAEVNKLVVKLAHDHARRAQAEAARIAAANTPEAKGRALAQNIARVSAESRGEKFSTAGWIDGPPQTQRTPSATDVSASIASYQARCREQARLRGEPEPRFGY